EAPQPVFPEPEAPAAAAAAPDLAEEEDDIPMPASSAPPPPYSTPGSGPGLPARSARFRRGSRGGAPRGAAGTPDIPRIGVVEVDPNFRPRGDSLPPRQPAAGPQGSTSPSGSAPERSERGERERGERGRGSRGGRGRGGENGERGERGRGRRGGRGGRGGQGHGPRRFEVESGESQSQSSNRMPESTPTHSEPLPPPPPPQPPAASRDDADGESFWSRVKRGLTGGNG